MKLMIVDVADKPSEISFDEPYASLCNSGTFHNRFKKDNAEVFDDNICVYETDKYVKIISFSVYYTL